MPLQSSCSRWVSGAALCFFWLTLLQFSVVIFGLCSLPWSASPSTPSLSMLHCCHNWLVAAHPCRLLCHIIWVLGDGARNISACFLSCQKYRLHQVQILHLWSEVVGRERFLMQVNICFLVMPELLKQFCQRLHLFSGGRKQLVHQYEFNLLAHCSTRGIYESQEAIFCQCTIWAAHNYLAQCQLIHDLSLD